MSKLSFAAGFVTGVAALAFVSIGTVAYVGQKAIKMTSEMANPFTAAGTAAQAASEPAAPAEA